MNSPRVRARLGLTAAFVLVTAVLTATSAAQTYVFNTAEFSTGHNPQAVANADLNGDGIPDLVVANYNDNTVSVFLGTSARAYIPGVTYETGPNPVAIAIADYNGDTKPDLAVLNNNCPTQPCAAVGSVSILLGNGDGTFQNQTSVNVGNNPLFIASGALTTGNSAIDLIVTNSADNTATVLANNGTGGFSFKNIVKTGNDPLGVVLADFNNDGILDLIVANSADSTISFFLGNGNATFTAPLVVTTIEKSNGEGGTPIAICVGDLNNAVDNFGKPVQSVALSTATGTVAVMINRYPRVKGFDGSENFAVAGPATQLVCSDFNNDGALDIAAVAPTTNEFSVLLTSNGNGVSYLPHVDYATGAGPSAITTTLISAQSFTGGISPSVAIVNGTDNTLEVFPGSLNGAFQMPQAAPGSFFIATGNQPSGLGAADFNGDGFPDLAVADRADNDVLVYLGNGNGTFTKFSGAATITGNAPAWVATGDFNGDGHQDMAVANSASNTVAILLGNGDGSFTTGTPLTTGKKPVAIAVGDLNNDGKADLAVVNENDPSVETFLGNGDGTFKTVKSYATGTGSTPNQVTIADFNNDGNQDLALAGGGNNSVEVFLGLGTGKFQIAANFAAGTDPTGVAVADFNGDGIKDLAVANNGSSTVSILLGNGNGTFGTHVDYPTATTPYLAFAVDMNGDNHADVVVSAASTTADRVSVMLGNGDGTLQTHVDHNSVFKGKATSQALAVGDFNLDNAPDIVTADQLANSVTVYMNTGVPAFTPGSAINLGGVDLGSSSSETLTLNNPGSAPLTGVAFSISGSSSFSEVNTCGTSLPAGANCTATVTLTPSAPGAVTGSLNLANDSLDNLQSVALTGEGNGATAVLNVTSLNFPVTLVGATSNSQTVTLTNTGNENLSITLPLSITAQFAQSNNCPTSLAPNASCIINVSFKPKVVGTITGTLSITDSALNSPQTVALSGIGTEVSLSTSALNFNPQQIGTTSAPQSVTITNVGKQTMSFTGSPAITITGTDAGDYAISSNSCGSTLGAGASCSVSVTFTPLSGGTLTADLSISDNGGNSPQLVSLTGSGCTGGSGCNP